jgi:hypothetical protein
LELSIRTPRLESNYVFIYKLQPLYFVRGNFWRDLHSDFVEHTFVKCPPQKNSFDSPNSIRKVLKTSIHIEHWMLVAGPALIL